MSPSDANLGYIFVALTAFANACGAHDKSTAIQTHDHVAPAAVSRQGDEPTNVESKIGPDAPPEPAEELVEPGEVVEPFKGLLGKQWQCSGEVDAGRLQGQLDAAAADFRECFVQEMVSKQLTQVDIQLIARVDKHGSVSDHVVRSTPSLPEPIACVEGVLRGLRLARPSGGNCVVLDYPLRFSIRY